MERPHIVTFEERFGKAKSSKVAATIPISPIYSGGKDDSAWLIGDRG